MLLQTVIPFVFVTFWLAFFHEVLKYLHVNNKSPIEKIYFKNEGLKKQFHLKTPNVRDINSEVL